MTNKYIIIFNYLNDDNIKIGNKIIKENEEKKRKSKE